MATNVEVMKHTSPETPPCSKPETLRDFDELVVDIFFLFPLHNCSESVTVTPHGGGGRQSCLPFIFFWFLFLKNRTVAETETNFGSSRFELGEVRSSIVAGLFLFPSFG